VSDGPAQANEGPAQASEPAGSDGPAGSSGPLQKDPQDWVTGDEPMTAPQESYLRTLAREAGADVPEGLSKAQAPELIDELQARSKRLRQQ
jgi:Protein of unknown function (DUF3072)